MFSAGGNDINASSVNTAMAENIGKLGDIPVSYTHLDVYKRQAFLRFE